MSDTAVTHEQNSNSVTLDRPLKRDTQTIDTLTLREPASGELRGLSLTDLLNLDVDALQTLLPRITQPSITKQEVAKLAPSDLVQLGAKVANFLVPKSAKDALASE